MVIGENGTWRLHDPEQPVAQSTFLEEMETLLSAKEVYSVQQIARHVYTILKEEWGKLGIKLIDLKIEFGRTADRRIIVGDVVDNDSWRLWPGGKKD